ncbi:hypothetical protein PICMEDRAFT_72367 [Pichia membranifaciens NRRL Y-2026]|uniref:Uncharacterized protein n=1 Tax=Pichia membranifaciens NRRL Y-2026 TaxID=763406 RepID=A0A1E3NJG3_9ASCO|nr:hypothetical protein PICMEDRAFT_72367 [Pichia membranifaciens NRRL Y-2026]ODQ46285.1 hypothetical protein PICMEDRAFT_72367 [Pichia membranifaciens NRRL Y-2026]
MSISIKRSITSSHQDSGLPKRQCLVNSNSVVNRLCAYRNAGRLTRDGTVDASSSSDDNDDEDRDGDDDKSDVEQAAERSNALKVKSIRFADSICGTPIDSRLSKAVSQYSDDEDDEDYDNGNGGEKDSVKIAEARHENEHAARASGRRDSSSAHRKEEGLCSSGKSSPFSEGRAFSLNRKRATSTNDILNVNYVSGHGLLNNKRYSVNISDVVSSIPNSSENFHSFNLSNKALKHSGNIPRCDFIARSRCFEYLVGAIDEAWARYCDSTSYDEDLAYGYDDSKSNRGIANTRNNDTDCNISAGGAGAAVANTPSSNNYSSDDDEGYKTEFSATTTVTEYDSDFHNQGGNKFRSFSMINNTLNGNSTKSNNNNNNRRVSEVPENVRLQELKDRFTKSKYYLEDLVDSDLHSDCVAFWTKWDLIKYSIVDFVEEDEEDDDIERKIDELEAGRFAGSFVN